MSLVLIMAGLVILASVLVFTPEDVDDDYDL
jgi:hypothetical protein